MTSSPKPRRPIVGVFLLLVSAVVAGCSGPRSDPLSSSSSNTPAEAQSENAEGERTSRGSSKPVDEDSSLSSDDSVGETNVGDVAGRAGNHPQTTPTDDSDHDMMLSSMPAADAPAEVVAESKARMGTAAKDGTEWEQAEPIRVLLLFESGPVLIDLLLLVDGIPYHTERRSLTDAFLSAADADEDGVVRWQEALASKAVNQGQFGQAVPDSAGERRDLAYQLDINRNDQVDRDEVMRFLLRGQADSRPLLVTSDVGNSETDPLFEWLDQNRSGGLEEAELNASRLTSRLRLLDANDDGQVTLAELRAATPTGQQAGESDQARKVLLIDEVVDWSRLLFDIEDYYALGSPIQPGDFLSGERIFAAVDEDMDGGWSVRETSRLLTIPADRVMKVRIGQAGDDAESVSPKMDANIVRLNQPMSVMINDSGEALSVRTTLDSEELRQSRAELERLAKEFSSWDSDSDRGLDKSEFEDADLPSRFGFAWDVIDANEDGRADLDEVCSLLNRRTWARRCQIRIRFVSNGTPLWSWFDQDGSGEISQREARAVELEKWDIDKSGDVAMGEVPPTFRLYVGRNQEPSMDDGRRIPNTVDESTDSEDRVARQESPSWFRAMDRNRDSELDRSEYLGDDESFTRLDQNGDGFLSPAEMRPTHPDG